MMATSGHPAPVCWDGALLTPVESASSCRLPQFKETSAGRGRQEAEAVLLVSEQVSVQDQADAPGGMKMR
jgi:hypothetical protein